ncbi:hypothetical protein Acor_37930 [Acrocarpospora corrugata]|uniref:DUF3311 domain-containing protein n=1 Tax=Acrocarpospora corrugata TaxID=35763 RepID=A0A5M3W0C7_9ACTN|nr:DUF3311 domain-containing protein [Acrocarpospora corrugata]GES01729.1 hypothetical protein Acor_37930 [Acrocarpospora corrugata]
MDAPRSDRNPWYWLLTVPVVVPLIPALFNSAEPHLFGIPLFYWLQLLFIGLSVAVTLLVYWRTRA